MSGIPWPSADRPAAPVAAADRLTRLATTIVAPVWRLLVSMRTALVLTLALAALAVVGSLVVQAPPDVGADGRAHAAWIDAVRPRYGVWTAVLDRLQAFTVFTSIWFRACVAILTVSLLACAATRTRRLWQRAVHPSTSFASVDDTRVMLQARFTTPLGPAAAMALVEAALGRRRYRVTRATGSTSTDLVAVRNRWAPFGSVVAHLSILVILLGAVVGAALGFHEPRVSVPIGASVEVGHGTGLVLRAEGFSDLYYPDGSPRDYASHVVLTRGGTPVADQDVRVNEPLRYGDISIYQSYFGAAASVRIVDPQGSTVFAGAVPLEFVTADGRHVVGRVALTDRATTVFVIAPTSGLQDPAILPGQLEIRVVGPRDPATARIRTLSQGVPATVDDLTVTFVREARFTGLIVARDPGRALVWIGAALLVGGLVVVLGWRERRLRATAQISPDGTEIRLAAMPRRPSDGDRAGFQRLTAEIDTALRVPGRDAEEVLPDVEMV